MQPNREGLARYSDEALLAELIERNGLAPGPRRSAYAATIRETVIDFGQGGSASIRLHAHELPAIGLADPFYAELEQEAMRRLLAQPGDGG